MPRSETAKLVAELSLKDKLSAGARSAIKSVQGIDKATSRTQKSVGKFGSNLGKTVAVGAAAVAASGIAVVNAARDYESAFAGVRKTVNATEPELTELSDAFRKMATEIPISAAELASLGEAGGALGIEGVDNLKEFVRVSALLGVTTDVASDQAATSLGVLSNVLHLTGDDYDNFASTLVALGNAGASTESQILELAERAGAAGELIGLSTDQVLGFSSAVASIGVDPEAGGTALQQLFLDLGSAVAKGGDDLKTFAKVSGQSAKHFKRSFEKDAGGALQDFLAGLGTMSKGDQIAALDDLGFSGVRLQRVLLGLANNTGLVTDQLNVAKTAFDENTALTKEAAERFKTFDSQLGLTKNTLTEIGITIGSKLLPKLAPLLTRLNAFITSNQGNISKFGDDVAAGVDKVATAVGKTNWTPFIDGLRMSADLAKGAFDLFNKIPDQLKALILVGAGINKFTGGLPVSIGKDIAGALGGALFDKFLARGSSPGNALWVQSVSGGVGGGPGGGVAGAARDLGKILQGVVILGAAQGLAAEIAGAVAGPVAKQVQAAVGGGPVNIFGPVDRLMRALSGDLRSDLEIVQDMERTPDAVRQPPNTGPALEKIRQEAGLTAARAVVTNDRLESIRGYTSAQAQSAAANVASTERSEAILSQQAQTAQVNVAATERSEAILAQKATENAAAVRQAAALAAGDSRAEQARIASAAAQQVAAVNRVKAAAQQTAFEVRDKDLSVTTKVTLNSSVSVSVRDGIHARQKFNSLFHQAS